ncbi:hypothetical protein CVT26_003840 [Gymnopilus dilepis]|uniref:DUF6533 domain-containing protein n=1 Tax=Gymnopilus dilepis TaxID=231916 RepID=A0A409YUW8_9AGAR|nr:hypothetical protein CVT26_003840 [Gymnopilus dilepis]
MKAELRNYLSLAALAFVVLDCIASLPLEYRYIWRSKFTATRLMYVISRYGALITLSIHYAFIHLFLGHGPVAAPTCRKWFLFLAGSSTVIQMSLVVILVLLVWALYKKNTKVVAGVVALAVLPFAVSFELMGRNIFQDQNFNADCELRQTPIEAAPLAVVVVLSHLALWVLIFRKRKPTRPTETRLMDSVVTIGNISFAVPSCELHNSLTGGRPLTFSRCVVTPYCFAAHTVDLVIIFIVPMVAISILYCKTVLLLLSYKSESSSKFLDTSEVVLTSVFATSFESHELRSHASYT